MGINIRNYLDNDPSIKAVEKLKYIFDNPERQDIIHDLKMIKILAPQFKIIDLRKEIPLLVSKLRKY